jgi:hypothetical protein
MEKITSEFEIREIENLLPKMLDKMFPSPPESIKWGRQFMHNNGLNNISHGFKRRSIKQQDFLDHFLQIPNLLPKASWLRTFRWDGSLIFQLAAETGRVKCFHLEVWEPRDVEVVKTWFQYLYLDEYQIDYIIEYAGERLGIWFFCDTSLSILDDFIFQFLNHKLRFPYGVFSNSAWTPKELVRLPGGYDFRTKCVNPIEFRGNIGDNPAFIMNSIINCKPIPEELMLNFLKVLEEPSDEIDNVSTTCTTSRY